ncbi:MAG: putative molybdenum carrier protein [Rhodospirillales bacterium]|nr:putative molybdenum carrier protein [Rhodospirillales bacterium]
MRDHRCLTGAAEGGAHPVTVVRRIVSGGQTGVDRAALDVAAALDIPTGGWVPLGRRAEDGPLPAHYPLQETASDRYAERTRLNVRDADATLVLCRGRPTRGTALTLSFARQLGRPHLVVDLRRAPPVDVVHAWLRRYEVRVLNVAGPRESLAGGIYAEAADYLSAVLTAPALSPQSP